MLHFATHNEETKASVVERFNRSLKTRMWRYFTKKQTIRYVDALQDFVRSYNDSYHRSIGMAPSAVNGANQETVWQRLYGHDGGGTPKYRVGDRVRISKAETSLRERLHGELDGRIVYDRRKRTVRIRPCIDWSTGTAIAWMAPSTNQNCRRSSCRRTRRIVSRRSCARRNNGREVLVKWFGYPESFNSWIDARTLTSYT